MYNPKVSVIIPTLNRFELLKQTLNSLQCQTFKDWEALVVDDGSNVDTVNTLQLISKEDQRIRYIKRSREVSGASACRNEGVELSQGKYIIFLDSDDNIKKTALANRFAEMEARPTLDFGVFPCMLFNEYPGDMNLLWNIDSKEHDIDRFLAQDIPWQTTSPIWRRESLYKLGNWDETLPSWQDWEFHFRALINDFKYKKFGEPDCFWRVPDRSNESSSIGMKSTSKTHLISHRQLFIKVYSELIRHEKLTEKRKKLISGLCIWSLDKFLFQNEFIEAKLTWNLYLQERLIDKTTYKQGLFYISLLKPNYHSKFLWRATRRGILEASNFLLPYEKRPYKKNLLRKVKVFA